MGRPTDYDPSYCEQVVEWGKLGKSLTWMAAQLEQSKQTLYNWMDANPEFMDAMTRAKVHAQAWWEDKGQDNLLTQGFQNASWSRSMAARFPDEWREVKGTELSGPNGSPIHMKAEPAEWTIVDPSASSGA